MNALCAALLTLLLSFSAFAAETPLLLGGTSDPSVSAPLLPEAECGKTSPIPCPSETGAEGVTQFLAAGAKAPTVEIDDPDGKPFSLGASGPTLIVFWSLFCEPCKEEFPLFCQLGGDYAAKGFDTVFVNLDGMEMSRTAKGFMKMNKCALPLAMDRKVGKSALAAQAYGVTGTPSLFLVGGDGVVRWSHVGRVDPAKVEAEIKAALGL